MSGTTHPAAASPPPPPPSSPPASPPTSAPPGASSARPMEYATRPYPVAEDPVKTHRDQLYALCEKLEAMRVRIAHTLDEDALAALQAAVTELRALCEPAR